MRRLILLLGMALLASCQSEPSLQKYFVSHTEDKNFLSVDLAPSMLNFNDAKMSPEQRSALKSFQKINVLAFRVNKSNQAEFETERAKVNIILKDSKYQQLMKFGSGEEGASVSFVGTDEHIDEFVIYANKNGYGFAVVRVLGKDMNPTGIMTMVGAIQKSNLNLEQLKPLQGLIQ